MNYFLGYDNSRPLLVGGHHNGQKMCVPLDHSFYEFVVEAQMDWRQTRGFIDLESSCSIQTETYRAEWFVADGRKFRVLIHESLPAHAALMLMMSMCGEHPDLVRRIAELEKENRNLKAMLKYAMS